MTSTRRIWLHMLAGEIAGLLFLLIFVVAVVTLPLKVVPDANAIGGRRVTVDQTMWKDRVESYAKSLARGSLGVNRHGQPVAPLVRSALGQSLKLVGYAGLLALIPGVVKGLWDFWQMRRRRGAAGAMLVGAIQGLPDFWVILWVQILAAWMSTWFSWYTLGHSYEPERPLSILYPVVCLALIPWAYIARLTVIAMNEVYERDYIRTARAKGLHEAVVMVRHGLRSALAPLLDSLPNVVTALFSSLLIVEYWFNYPGLALLLKESVAPAARTRFDPPGPPDVSLLLAAGLTLGLLFWLFYLLVRLGRRLVDPRLRQGGQI